MPCICVLIAKIHSIETVRTPAAKMCMEEIIDAAAMNILFRFLCKIGFNGGR